MTISFTVVNSEKYKAQYNLHAVFYNLTRPNGKAPVFEFVEFTPLDKLGNDIVEKRLIWDKGDIIKEHDQPTDRSEEELRSTFELAPLQRAKVRMAIVGFERMQNGDVQLLPRLKTVNVTLKVHFPSTIFEKSVYFAHSKRDNNKVCFYEETDQDITASIAGLLVACCLTRESLARGMVSALRSAPKGGLYPGRLSGRSSGLMWPR
jgi:hypothetical protein